ncbi:MAG: hypothetical protein ACP5U2_09730 [Bryobacteraceae bacterium]
MAGWIRAALEFASFYSYRVPDSSPSYALCSPAPSPAAIRLALVDAIIRHTGSVSEGRRFFEAVKSVPLEIEVPERLAVVRFFSKRLKPEKPAAGKTASVLESTGSREYCLPAGELVVWVQGEERIAQAFRWLRRLGTTDSLVSCRVDTGKPDLSVCLKAVETLPPLSTLAGRPVYTLHELAPGATFDHVNPYASPSRRGRPFLKRLYVLPLVREQAGENWVIYRREPFPPQGG